MEQIKTIHEPAREIPVRASVDILVVGAGPSGLMAAQAAAAEGLKVMLIESRSYLGRQPYDRGFRSSVSSDRRVTRSSRGFPSVSSTASRSAVRPATTVPAPCM